MVDYYVDYVYGKLRSYIQPMLGRPGTVDEVFPDVYLGDFAAACNREKLRELGITHILCTILGVDPVFPKDFVYKNVHLRDNERQNVMPYLDQCVEYIEAALKNGGRVFVHCMCGVSRSSTMVIAYLISRHSKAYSQALEEVREHRAVVNPNKAFQHQLVNYDVMVSQRRLQPDEDGGNLQTDGQRLTRSCVF